MLQDLVTCWILNEWLKMWLYRRKYLYLNSLKNTLFTEEMQIVSIVKPTRCVNVSNLFYWSNAVHVSDGLSVHHQELKTVHTATGTCQTDTANCLVVSSRQHLFDICLLQCVQSLTPVDGQRDHPKHAECYSNKMNLRHWYIWLVLP